MASHCFLPGRIEAAVRYADAAQQVLASRRYEVPFGLDAELGVAYVVIGQPERTAEWCRAELARGRDTHTFAQASLTIALALAGCGEEARVAVPGRLTVHQRIAQRHPGEGQCEVIS